MKLTVLREFTDRNGRVHSEGESIDVQNDQEAQEYIRAGQARQQQESGSQRQPQQK